MAHMSSDQIHFIGHESVKATINWGGGGMWKGSLGCNFLGFVHVCRGDGLWEYSRKSKLYFCGAIVVF